MTKKETLKPKPKPKLKKKSAEPAKKRALRNKANYDKIAKDAKKKKGAPEFPYCEEIALLLCEAIASCPYGLEHICRENPDFPRPTTIYKWRHIHPAFAKKYVVAKQRQAEIMAENIIDIADDKSNDTIVDDDGNERPNTEWIARSKLRIDSRKWLASKLAPKVYGPSLNIDDASYGESLRKELAKRAAKINKHDKEC